MSTTIDTDQAFLDEVRRIARDIAAAHCDAVDQEARFPVEAIDALREAGALSSFVPAELGGAGVSFAALAEACFELGRRCSATAMVFAMHQIEVVTMVRHLEEGSWYESYLAGLPESQRLIASVTSEVGTGGDMGRSVAAVEPDGSEATFTKQAPTVSYGGHADDFFTTLRRAPDAEPGDQVLVLTSREQTELEQTGTWDPLGMRGTCSPGFVVKARFSPDQVLGVPFGRVAPESMVPVSHILWSHLWLGIATDAFDRARAFVRAAAKRTPGQTPPSAARLSHVMSQLALLRAEVGLALREFDEWSAEPDRQRLTTLAGVLRFNNLKIASSEQAPRICQDAMAVCGIVGFKNDTPFSCGRLMRDAMSGALMVANERIHQTNAGLLLIAKEV